MLKYFLGGFKRKKAAYREGAHVSHKTYGFGKIIKVDGDIMTVRFDKTRTVKTFSIPICIENNLFEFRC